MLPFLFLFALFFAVLQKVAVFRRQKLDAQGNPVPAQGGDGFEMIANKQVNGIVSFVLAALVTVPHILGRYDPNMDPIVLIYQFLPNAGVMLVAFIVMLLLLGMARVNIPSAFVVLLAVAAAGLMLFTFLLAIFPAFLPAFDFLRDPATQAIIFVVSIIGLIGYFVFKEPKPEPPYAHERFYEFFGEKVE